MTIKITFSTETLLDAVSKASLWVTKKSPIQALQCVRFTLGENVLTISAVESGVTDITLYIDASGIDGNFDVCIPADRILPKLQVFAKSSAEVTMSFGKVITLSTDKHRSRVNPIDTEYFPEIDRSYVANAPKVDTDEFITATKMTMAAADPKSPFPALEGIYIDGNNMVSADGARLSIYTTSGFMNDSILVPATSLAKIIRAIEGISGVSVYRAKDKLVVEWDGGAISSTLISYQFPDYKSVMPEEYETRFLVDRGELLDAVNLAAVDALDSENLVVISASEEDGVKIFAESSTGEHSSVLDCLKFEGVPKKFGISFKYLKDAVTKLKSGAVEFGVNEATALIVLSDSENYRYGIMPMHYS